MFRIFKCFGLIFSILTHFIDADQRWHMSQHALKQLYNLQIAHFDILNDYLNLETKRLEELKSNLDAMHKWHSFITDFYSHYHINNIKLMKNIYHQLRKIEDLINNEQSIEVFKQIEKHKDLGDDDIVIAHQGMRRLQMFYMISASDMAAGRHNNRIIGDQMDACECYVMTKCCFEQQDMYGVIDWAIETYTKWKNHGQPKCVDTKKLNFYIISSSVYTGFDFTNAFHQNKLNTSDDSEKFKRFSLLRKKDIHSLNRRQIMNIYGTYETYYKLRFKKGEIRFRELCMNIAPKRILTKYSKCRYQTKNSPYRILMPFKEEDIYNEPNIKIYHDVLYDEEILNFKNFALKDMSDAQILTPSGNGSVVEDYRSCQVSRQFPHNTSKILNARIEDFTGYSTKTAENYQIVNYGLGGHYSPHYDAYGKLKTMSFGDRLVTVLFYMNDVQNYGSTVFPYLDVICPPEKGAALVWNNLNMTDGNKLITSLHGSCPIVKGNKWIMTRWLLEEGQHLTYRWRDKINS